MHYLTRPCQGYISMGDSDGLGKDFLEKVCLLHGAQVSGHRGCCGRRVGPGSISNASRRILCSLLPRQHKPTPTCSLSNCMARRVRWKVSGDCISCQPRAAAFLYPLVSQGSLARPETSKSEEMDSEKCAGRGTGLQSTAPCNSLASASLRGGPAGAR